MFGIPFHGLISHAGTPVGICDPRIFRVLYYLWDFIYLLYMKFKDILEVDSTEDFIQKRQELLDIGRRYTNATDFRVTDVESYEESKTLGLRKILGHYWSKLPKSKEDLLRIGKIYSDITDFRRNDKTTYNLVKNDNEIWDELNKIWNKGLIDTLTDEFISSSEKRYRMSDPNNPTKTIPRFNYDKLKEIGLERNTIKRNIYIPANSLYCKTHNTYFPNISVSIYSHLSKSRSESSGCSLCSSDALSAQASLHHPRLTLEEWIEKFKQNSSNRYPSNSSKRDELKYDYSNSWITTDEKELRGVKKDGTPKIQSIPRIHNIKCKIHNYIFPKNEEGIQCQVHSKGQSNCPKCSGNESIGEDRMNGILINIYGEDNIKKQEKNISGLTFKGGQLRFDGYVNVDGKEIYFEFDGKQHFIYYETFQKTTIAFYESIARDIIKNNYCKRNNIKLIRIGYKDSNNMEDEIKGALEDSSQMVLSTNYPQLGWNTPDMEKNDPYLYRYLKQFKVIEESGLKLMDLI